jgi:hypothetical protein
LSAFCAERALPSGVFGPRDFAPFRRLVSARVLVAGTAARAAAPRLDMAGILDWRVGLEMAESPRGARPEERQSNRF